MVPVIPLKTEVAVSTAAILFFHASFSFSVSICLNKELGSCAETSTPTGRATLIDSCCFCSASTSCALPLGAFLTARLPTTSFACNDCEEEAAAEISCAIVSICTVSVFNREALIPSSNGSTEPCPPGSEEHLHTSSIKLSALFLILGKRCPKPILGCLANVIILET